MSFKLLWVLLLLAVLAAGVLVGWARTRNDQAANAPRGRARVQVAWALGVAALTGAVLATARLEQYRQNQRGWIVLVLVVAVAVLLALRPRLAYRIGPVVLIMLGLAGFLLVRHDTLAWAAQGLLRYAPGYPWPQELVLVLAWVCLLLGGWLVWTTPDPVVGRARLLLGRVGELAPRAQLRALVLLPVAIMVAELVRDSASDTTGKALLWLALALGGAVLVLRRWPGAAAGLAVVGLLVMGVVGLVMVVASHESSPPVTFRDVPLDYVAVIVGPISPGLVVLQSLVLLATGAWLMPRAFPATGRLFGLAPDAELTQRVQRLTESRAIVVDTASSDLRRLERDLHDGAQARLVAVGMSLRAAERLIPENPAAAVALVAEARETSARALTELRELVRGVLPPVLADRGLADAVRALALDCPLAVETRIDLPGRPAKPVETACYFAVAELLTNAAKHSGARDARIDVSHHDRLLRIEVTDFGLGGADPAAGSGLAGVEKRLAAFDGIMAINSPAGGPTIVVLEVPCALSSAKTSSC